MEGLDAVVELVFIHRFNSCTTIPYTCLVCCLLHPGSSQKRVEASWILSLTNMSHRTETFILFFFGFFFFSQIDNIRKTCTKSLATEKHVRYLQNSPQSHNTKE